MGIAVWLVPPTGTVSNTLWYLMHSWPRSIKRPCPSSDASAAAAARGEEVLEPYPDFHPHITLVSVPRSSFSSDAVIRAARAAVAGFTATASTGASTNLSESTATATLRPLPQDGVHGQWPLSGATAVIATAAEDGRQQMPRHPLTVSFAGLVCGDHYFRSVYLAVHLTPALAALRAALLRELAPATTTTASAPDEDRSAFPHLSLCYIDDATDTALCGERKRMHGRLAQSGCVVERASGDGTDGDRDGGVAIREGSVGETIASFVPSEMWVVDCDGPVESWKGKVLEKIALV